MAIINKTIPTDYSTISGAITDMLVSGLAASGLIDTYVLNIDYGLYSGFPSNINIPYSGRFNIYGNYSDIIIDDTVIFSGISLPAQPSFTFNNSTIISNTSGYTFESPSGFNTTFSDCNIVSSVGNSGFITHTDNTVKINNSTIMGLSSGNITCINGEGTSEVSVINSTISNFTYGIIENNVDLISSDNNYNKCRTAAIVVGSGSYVDSSQDLIYNCGSGIIATSSSVNINKDTMDCDESIILSSGTLAMNDSIISGSILAVSGSLNASGTITNSALIPSGLNGFIGILTNVSDTAASFADTSIGDYRLLFDNINGSNYINYKPTDVTDGNFDVSIDPIQFLIYSDDSKTNIYDFLPYIYKQGSSLLFTDYNNEVKFANTKQLFSDLTYTVLFNAKFEQDEVTVKSTMSSDDSPNPYPYDWDYKKMYSTKIDDNDEFIIPRTYINITDYVSNTLGGLGNALYSNFNKSNIRVYNTVDYRGVSYDFDATVVGAGVSWYIEGRNQSLIKRNIYTGETLAKYPLLTMPKIKTYQRPSGIVYTHNNNEKYMYYDLNDSTKMYTGENDNGDFQWLNTEIDLNKDVRGILATDNKLYITATEYNVGIYDRTTIRPSGGIGKVLQYNNNDIYEHYIGNYNVSDGIGPSHFILTSGNDYPTDITVYEDGSLHIADFTNNSGLYKYNFAYDYAIVQSRYDSQTRILLREEYDDVDI